MRVLDDVFAIIKSQFSYLSVFQHGPFFGRQKKPGLRPDWYLLGGFNSEFLTSIGGGRLRARKRV